MTTTVCVPTDLGWYWCPTQVTIPTSPTPWTDTLPLLVAVLAAEPIYRRLARRTSGIPLELGTGVTATMLAILCSFALSL